MSFKYRWLRETSTPSEWFDLDRSEKTMPDDEKIKCPKCKSEAVYCYDEQYEDFEDSKGEFWSLPVGYMKCDQCGFNFAHFDWTEDDGITQLRRI